MTKSDAQVLKGIAILLMIFLHLFNSLDNANLCNNLIIIDKLPLVYILTRASNPVPFFLILSGYGMYMVYKNGKDEHRYKRILKLYLHYFIITIVFLIIGHIIFNKQYPTALEFISNITGYDTSFNQEAWFILPYSMLSLTSLWLFKYTNRFSTKRLLIFLFLVNICTSYLVSRYGTSFIYKNKWLCNPLMFFHLSFAFYMGAMSAKYDVLSHFKKLSSKHIRNTWFFVLLLITLIFLRCLLQTSIVHVFYAYLFITLCLQSPLNRILSRVLVFLGRHSMNMWLIHTWFCYYLFHDFIYGFRYPIIVFLVLVVVSLICSIIINIICLPIEKIMFKK